MTWHVNYSMLYNSSHEHLIVNELIDLIDFIEILFVLENERKNIGKYVIDIEAYGNHSIKVIGIQELDS